MATFNVSSAAQLAAALASAHAGDTILLAGGNYGDVTISKVSFSSQVTIESADPSNPAVFRSLAVSSSHFLTFQDVEVHYTPTSTTIASDSAVKITNCSDIILLHSDLQGGLSVNGVPQTASALDSTQDVIGMPAARAMTISGSSNIQILSNEIATFDRGIVLSNVTGLNISGNEIHDLRRTPIDGGNVSQTLIADNYIHDITPWNWGAGDHADFIHIWTVPTAQTGPSAGLIIKDNYLAQGSGTAVLGIYLDDNNNGLGFTGAQIVDNVIYNGNAQGLRLERVMNSTVDGNVLVQSSGALKVGPGILTAGDTTGLTISHNILSGLDLGHLTGDARGNVLVQDVDPSLPHYDGMVEGSPLSWAQAMQLRHDYTGASYVGTSVPGTGAGIQENSGGAGNIGGSTAGGTNSSGTTTGSTDTGGTSTGSTGTGGTTTGSTDTGGTGSGTTATTGTSTASTGGTSSGSTPSGGDAPKHFPSLETRILVHQAATAADYGMASPAASTTTATTPTGNGSITTSQSASEQFVWKASSLSTSTGDQPAHATAAQVPEQVLTTVQQAVAPAAHEWNFQVAILPHDLSGVHQMHFDQLFS